MTLIRLAFRDLIARKQMTALIVLNLVVASVGLILVISFESSMQQELDKQSLGLLGADIAVSGRRSLSPAEQEKVLDSFSVPVSIQQTQSFYSMTASKSNSRLSQIKVVEKSFPFYGSGRVMRKNGSVDFKTALAELTDREILIYPELFAQLNVQVGDTLQIGQLDLTVAGSVDQDVPSAGLQELLAPRIYLLNSTLHDTGLIRKGSMVHYQSFFHAPTLTLIDQQKASLEKILNDSNLKIRTPKDASQRAARLANYVNDFLGLVLICAIFLTVVACTFLFNILLTQKTKDIGTLLSLGSRPSMIAKIIFTQLTLLVMITTVIAAILSFFMMPLLYKIASFLMPLDVPVSVNTVGIGLSFVFCWVIAIIACLPSFEVLGRVSPLSLMREYASGSKSLPFAWWIWILPTTLLLLAACIWQANSWIIGSLFFTAFAVSIMLFLFFGWCIRWAARRLTTTQNFAWWFAFKHIERNRAASTIVFVALCVSTSLTLLVPQVNESLQKDLSLTSEKRIPSLFLFDIQEEDLEPLQNLIDLKGSKLENLSPMVRARLLFVNGKEFKSPAQTRQTREQQRENSFRNRTFNLSSRPALLDSEKIVSGKPFSGVYQDSIGDGPPIEISVEEDFANDLSFKIGDALEFEIEGVRVQTVIKNFRQVRWASFEPNFFVMTQYGSLKEAPKIYIGNVASDGQQHTNQLQYEIVKEVPNISIVDVRRTVAAILDLTSKISTVIQFMAWLVTLGGLAVFASIVYFQIYQRQWDIGLLKALGAKNIFIQKSLIAEFAFLTGSATLIGAIVGQLNSILISHFVFETTWSPNFAYVVFPMAIALTLSILLTLLVCRPVLKASTTKTLLNK